MYNTPGLKQAKWRWATTKDNLCIYIPKGTPYQGLEFLYTL